MGTARVRETVLKGKAKLLVVAEDASVTQTAKVVRPAQRRGVSVHLFGTRASLGEALGTGPTTVVAVTEDSLAEAVTSRLLELGATAE